MSCEDLMAKLVEAMNATTTPERLAELAADPDAGVRRGVARHPATPPAALERLAADQDAGVRWGVAWHQAAPAAALERLAADPDAVVRWRVAKHPATPAAALELLAADHDDGVRLAAAINPWRLTRHGMEHHDVPGREVYAPDLAQLAADAKILFVTQAPAWPAPRRATKADLESGRSFLIRTETGWCQEVGGDVALGDWIMDQPPPPPGEEAAS